MQKPRWIRFDSTSCICPVALGRADPRGKGPRLRAGEADLGRALSSPDFQGGNNRKLVTCCVAFQEAADSTQDGGLTDSMPGDIATVLVWKYTL